MIITWALFGFEEMHYILHVIVRGTNTSWTLSLKKYIALSTTKTKNMAISKCSKELIWLKNFLSNLGLNQEDHVLN